MEILETMDAAFSPFLPTVNKKNNGKTTTKAYIKGEANRQANPQIKHLYGPNQQYNEQSNILQSHVTKENFKYL